jgi:hypothetical protein
MRSLTGVDWIYYAVGLSLIGLSFYLRRVARRMK